MKTFLQAIATMEGYYNAGTRPNRLNNPGDIIWGTFASSHGSDGPETLADGKAGRFAKFPDAATGFNAMRTLLQTKNYKGLTVEAALNRWAPPSDGNDTSHYVATVCKIVGCQPTDIIDELVKL